MTTIAQVRDRISRRLSGEATILIDRLNGAIGTTSVETLTVEFGNAALAEGSVIEIGTEQMYVISLSTLTVTVLRGWNGTTATTHADNALVYINPRWTLVEIAELIEEELRSWPMQLGRVATEQLTLPANQVQAPFVNSSGLPIIRVLDVNVHHDARSRTTRRDRVEFRLLDDYDSSEFAARYALQVGQSYSNARILEVAYLTIYQFAAVSTASTDLETTIGLDARHLDILIFGVMWRAVSTREAGRTDSSATQVQENERVPPTHLTQTSAALKQIRDKRIVEEITRMYDQYPVLMTTGG